MSEGINIYNMTLKQGSTFQKVITWKNADGTVINLTGYTARMQLKRKHQDVDPEFTLTTENSRITIDGTAGKVTLNIAAGDTALLTGKYVYDLELVNGSYVDRILQGEITLDREVTK